MILLKILVLMLVLLPACSKTPVPQTPPQTLDDLVTQLKAQPSETKVKLLFVISATKGIVHRMNENHKVVAEKLHQDFVDLPGVRLGSNRVAELALDHTEDRLDVRGFLELSQVYRLGPGKPVPAIDDVDPCRILAQ